MRRKATSAESTLGGGRKTVRETGGIPSARSRAGRARRRRRRPSSTGRRRSGRRPRAAPSRTRARRREPVEALGDDRRRDVVRQVRDELRRRRVESSRGRAASASPQCERHVRRGRDVAEVRLEAPVELDRVDVGALVGEHARQERRGPGRSRARRRPGRAPQAARSRRGCCRRRGSAARATSSGRPAHGAGSPKAAVAFRSICAARARRRPRPAASARTASVCSDVGRLVPLAAQRLRREVRAVGLGEDPVDGNGRCRLAELGRLRVGDVARRTRRSSRARAPTRAAPARRSSGGSTVPGEAGERGRRVGVGVARVDHDRQAELPPRARAARRRARAARGAARGRGSSRGPSRRRRRPADARAARELVDPRRLRRRRPDAGRSRALRRRPARARRSRARRGRTRSPCRS